MRQSQVDLRNALGQVLNGKQNVVDEVPALLGAYTPQGQLISVPGKLDYCYARLRGNDAEVVEVFNDTTIRKFNYPIKVVWISGRWEVTGRNKGGSPGGFGGQPGLANHAQQHMFYGGTGTTDGVIGDDVVWVNKRQFMPLNVTPTTPTSMKVRIWSDYYMWAGTYHWYPGTETADLTALVPANSAQARFVTVYIDASENLGYVTGSLFAYTGAIHDPESVIAIPPAGSGLVLAAMLLNGHYSSIDWPYVWDMRSVVQGFGDPGTGTHSPVTLSADADITFILNGQELGIEVQDPHEFWGGPTGGVAGVPTWRTIEPDDLPWITGSGMVAHDIDGVLHTVSGRTAGEVLIATGANTFGWSDFMFTGVAGQTYAFPAVSGTVALGAGTLTSTTANDVSIAAHTHAITPKPALVGPGGAQYQVITAGIGPAYIPDWSGFLVSGTTGGRTNFAITNNKVLTFTTTETCGLTLVIGASKTLTLTSADTYDLTIPKTGTAAVGTGTAGRVAEWVTDSNTLQASTLIKTGTNTLTLATGAAAATTWTIPINASGVLTNDGSGGLSWGAAATAPGGSDTQVQFNDGGVFGGDADFTWNKTTNALTLVNAVYGDIVISGAQLAGKAGTVGTPAGTTIVVVGGAGYGAGIGGNFYAYGGAGGATGDGGAVQFQGGNGGATSGAGGPISFVGGNAAAGNSNGGNIAFRPGIKSGAGTAGKFLFQDADSMVTAILDTSLLATSDKTYTLPNITGTVALGTGTAGQVAEWVTNSNTLQAAKLIGPAANILTFTATHASTLGMAVDSGKTITLTATDNAGVTFTGACVLTIPTAGAVTAALLGTANAFTLTNTFASQIGIGTTDIEAWNASYRAIEGYRSAVMFGAASDYLALMSNAYYDGAWKYKATAVASLATQSAGAHKFYVAVSGNADAAITWITALTIGAGGGVNVGGATDPGNDNFLVDGTITSIGALAVNQTVAGLARNTFANVSDNAARRSDIKITTGSAGTEAIYFGIDQATTAYLDNRTGKDLEFQVTGTAKVTFAATGVVTMTSELRVAGDVGGAASTNTLTGTSNVAVNSTGVGTIKFKGATNRDSSGFIKIYIGTTAYYVPVFSAITG